MEAIAETDQRPEFIHGVRVDPGVIFHYCVIDGRLIRYDGVNLPTRGSLRPQDWDTALELSPAALAGLARLSTST